MIALQPAVSIMFIRNMQLEDLEQVQEIDRLSFSLPWPASAYHYELERNPNSLLRVAVTSLQDGRETVIGLLVVWLVLDEAHIASIAVHPDYRGQGVGQRLLVQTLQEVIRKGSRMATLEVRASNLVAQGLYRRFQFEIAGSRPRYYRDNNEDALIMTVSNLGDAYLTWLESGGWKNGIDP
jgi:ribosomal-protein-alanine N-acetyltransferase